MTEKNGIISNRIELVFLYDVRDANPNGDPDNSNMPRMDDATGENIVTDVRLKRTIRDYWLDQGKKVIVRAETTKDGHRKSMENLATDFLDMGTITKSKAGEARLKIASEMPEEFIDVRTFGAAVTLPNANYSHTGAVQFGLGRSLNLPMIKTRTITTTLASGEERGQGTMGAYHTVDYSLIKFHGIINEKVAQQNNFTGQDYQELIKALWYGTKNLNTRTKFNHLPRLLISVKTKENKTQIGDLDLTFSLIEEEEVQSITEVKLEVSKFIEKLETYSDIVEEIQYAIDPELPIYIEQEKTSLETFITKLPESIPISEFDFIEV